MGGMCGICGLAGRVDRDALSRMTASLAHRGPDDEGVFVDEPAGVALGHRRLAIIDLSPAGHQPMANDDGTLVLVFNGEIYNFRELRQDLIARGHRFRSGSDTEVILRLYEETGPAGIARLNGIFAFALWDARRSTLVLARDHLGVKPLYYTTHGSTLAFASEVKALFEAPGVEPQLDPDGLELFMTFLWTPDPVTTFTGVSKLPAGHYAEWHDGRLRLTEYWDLRFPPEGHAFAGSEADLVAEFRDRFGDAVERQLVSDVPVGAFLSAGLDSNSIVAAMATRTREPVRTYTIAFHPRHRAGDLTLDDPAVAARAAAHYGSRHTEIVVDPDVADLLPRLVWHMDEPTADPALIMAYLVSREARREVTVLLSGLGGDEVLGGYRKYIAAQDARRYQRLPEPLRAQVLDPLFRNAPARPGTPWAGYGRLLRKWGRSASMPPREQFVTNGTYLGATDRDGLFAPAFRARLHERRVARFHEAAFARVDGADWLNQMLYVDTKIFMASLNLTYNDKMSMASAVEVRVPFLDRELVDWVASTVPPSMKIRGRETKSLLRQAFGAVLPAEVLHQPKAGFGAPIGYWLTHDLRDMVDDLLHPDRVRRRGVFDPATVARFVAEQRAGSIERAWNVWQLLTLELWMQAFLDRKPAPVGVPQVAAR
jgi:asparagine synthase (glutamine-hydrolysing)